MSISDRIVVMDSGILQQQGRPQEVYDDPENLFVARFLGDPAINVFTAELSGDSLYIGNESVLQADPARSEAAGKASGAGAPGRPVLAGIRPEGLIPERDGPLSCALTRIEITGRDTGVICTHPACDAPAVRAVLSSDRLPETAGGVIRFRLDPKKVCLFDPQTGARIKGAYSWKNW